MRVTQNGLKQAAQSLGMTEHALMNALQQGKQKSGPVEIKEELISPVTRPEAEDRINRSNRTGKGKKRTSEETIELQDTDSIAPIPISLASLAPVAPLQKRFKVQSKFDRVVASFPQGLSKHHCVDDSIYIFFDI